MLYPKMITKACVAKFKMFGLFLYFKIKFNTKFFKMFIKIYAFKPMF